MPDDEAKQKARESASLVVGGVIEPVLQLAEHLMRDEFRDIDKADIHRFFERVMAIVVTGRDPREIDPNARINFGDVGLNYMRALIEGNADDTLEREDRGLPTD